MTVQCRYQAFRLQEWLGKKVRFLVCRLLEQLGRKVHCLASRLQVPEQGHTDNWIHYRCQESDRLASQ